MTNEEKFRKSLADLTRLTGLPFTIDEEAVEDYEAAAERLTAMVSSLRERNSRSDFLRRFLSGELTEREIYDGAGTFHIATEERRLLYVVEVSRGDLDMAMTILKQLFLTRSHDMAIRMGTAHIALVRSVSDREKERDFEKTARTIVDMLNTEAMIPARVAFSGVTRELMELPGVYREARYALEIGRIFYMNETVMRFDHLGLGRLIYELPPQVCRLFLAEVFGDRQPEQFDEETQATIDTFFDNNLNISETARQLFVHRNTLVYRLEKIHQATGLDIRLFEDAMTFKIASMLNGYLRERGEEKNTE